MCILSACDFSQGTVKKFPKAVKGVLDLRDWDFKQNGLIDLSGEYEFYWKQFLTADNFSAATPQPQCAFIDVPKSWNGFLVDNEAVAGTGFATYRLTVLVKNVTYPLALKFLDMGTAYSVYVDGENLASIGYAREKCRNLCSALFSTHSRVCSTIRNDRNYISHF